MKILGITLLLITTIILSSCSKSEFSTTQRYSHNGKVTFINHPGREKKGSRSSSQEKYHARLVKDENVRESTALPFTKNESIIVRINPAENPNPLGLMASVSAEPLILPITEIYQSRVGSVHEFGNPSPAMTFRAKPIPARNFMQGDSLLSQREKPGVRKLDGLALSGFIISFLGLIPLIGIAFAVIGLVLSSIGLHRIRKHPDRYKGKGFAIAGKWMGIAGIIVTFGTILGIFIALIVSGTNNNPNR